MPPPFRQSSRIFLLDENPNDGPALRQAVSLARAECALIQVTSAEGFPPEADAAPAPVAVVVDWSLTFADAAELIRRSVAVWPRARVLVFCRTPPEPIRASLLRLGLPELPTLVGDFAALVAHLVNLVAAPAAPAAPEAPESAPGGWVWDRVPFGVACVDIRDGSVRRANQTLGRWLACAPAALTGARLAALHPPEQVRRLSRRFAADEGEAGAPPIEVSFRRGDDVRFADAWVAGADDGRADGRTVFYVDAAERRALERRWRRLAETIFQTGGGEAFFHTLVEGLCAVLEVDMAAVALVLPGAPARTRIVALWDAGAAVAGWEMAMAGNPCAEVLRHQFLCVTRRLDRAFPAARWLLERGAESYLGLPLFDQAGRAIGILEVMHRRPLGKTRDLRAVMQIFATRAAAELERLRAESARRQTEAGLAHTQRLAHIGSWELDLAANRLAWSDELYRIHGVGRETFDLSVEAALGLMHETDRARVGRILADALAGRGFPRFHHRITRPDGGVRHLECEGELVADARGRPQFLRGTMLDVTERVACEREVRQLSSVVRATENAVLLADEARRVTWVNEAFTRLTGRGEEEVRGRRVEEVFGGPAGAECGVALGTLWAEEPRAADVPCRHPSGRSYWIGLRVEPLPGVEGGADGWFATALDITERKLTEDARRLVASGVGHRREDHLFTLLARETAALLGCEICLLARRCDPERPWVRTLAWTREGERQPDFEYPLAGTPCGEATVGDGVVHAAGVAARFPSDPFLGEARVESYAGVPMFDPDGGVLGHVAVLDRRRLDRPPEQVLAVLRLVADRAAVEIVRAEGERMFRGLFAQAPDATLLVDRRGRIVLANEAALRMFGYAGSELVGLDVEHLMPAAARARHAGLREGFHHAPQARPMGLGRGDLKGLRKDGSEFPVDISLSPLETPDGPGVVAAIRDVTAQRLAEAQLRQGQKMESLGRLAGGIAHDFNNILSGILGFAELTLLDLPGGHPLRDNLLKIQQAGLRARTLVAQILAASRQAAPALAPVRLETVAAEVLALLRPTLPATTVLVFEVAPDCPPILADASQLHQVVMNLCLNAWQALPHSTGRIEVRVHPCAVDAGAAAVPGLRAGPQVRLAVRDTGTGMDAATVDRAFDPFFTTKGVGRGTGLGLAVVQGIVRAHHGAITLRSTPGVGTEFEVDFPAVDDPPSAAATAPEAGAAPAPAPDGAGQRILLVDDDPITRPVLADQLRRLGYRPVAHRDPADALADLERNPQGFDLVVTDMTMPGISGVALAHQARLRRADLPVVLITGLASPATREAAEAAGVRDVLLKPVAMEQLRAALRRSLG